MPLLAVSRAKNDEGEEIKEEENYIVEGYAARYEPYELFQDADGSPVYEQFTKENFEGANRDNIILQFDHAGMVYGRTGKNLEVTVDDEGLFVRADLSLTTQTRELYEQIASGLVDKMSWRFTVADEDRQYDSKTKTLSYKAIQKIWDVSAVSIPANENTSIASARSFVDGVIGEEARSEAVLNDKRKKLELKLKLGGFNNV